MKAITLTQPWAQLVALGAKRIETRSWSTTHRGLIAIHAGKGPGEFGKESALWQHCLTDPFRAVLLDAGYGNPGRLPRGEIVAVARLIDVHATAGSRPGSSGPKYADWVHDLTDQERAFGDYSPGRYGWLLDGVLQFATPIPCRGALGLWTVPAPIAAQLAAVPA